MRDSKFKELTQGTLKDLLHYNQITGVFTHKERDIKYFNHCNSPTWRCKWWNTRFSGKKAGSIWTSKKAKTSYIQIKITLNGKTKKYLAHRLAILYTDGYFPPEDEDHIDGNGLNNSRINLREVNRQENNKNMPMRSDNVSETVGVSWFKRDQKWQTYINVNGKNIHGGLFTNKSDAIQKRKELEIQYNFHKNHGRRS